MKKFYNWYKLQTGVKKIVIMFCLNWVYWFAVIVLFDLIWPGAEAKSWAERLFYTTWMALWWTVLWDRWISKLIKQKRNEQAN